MSPCDVIEYGQLLVDNIIEIPDFPTPQVDVIPTGDSYDVGGTVAITTLWMAVLGLRVCPAGGCIGLDEYGNLLWERLSANPRIDLSLIERRADIRTPMVRTLLKPDGERAFIALLTVEPIPHNVPTLQHLRQARAFSIGLHASPEAVPVLAQAQAAGLLTLVGDLVHTDHPNLPASDVIVTSTDLIRGHVPGSDPVAHAHALWEICRGRVIITDGGGPVYAIDSDGSSLTLRPPAVPVVDTTGAGDAFKAGLTYGLLQGFSLAQALAWGAACGAHKVQHFGPSSGIAGVETIGPLVAMLRAEPL